ncbi:MAG: glycosyltransferase family 2 protein [Thermoflexales bacterium]|nr:glycosyltransferase family 2 protein [Thermoflexales bacterium]
MTLAIVILSWNTAPLLADCLRSIPAGAEGIDYQLIVVDNGSSDGSADMVARDFADARLIRNADNMGFTRANNQGIRASGAARYILLLNSDTLVRPGALHALVHFMDEHPQAGAVSPRLLRPDGSPQPYAFGGDPTPGYLLMRGLKQLVLHRYLHDWATGSVQEVDWVSGACLMVRREALEQAGLLDEAIFMYFEDNDWCLRIRQAGWKVYYNPQVEIVHIGGQSLKKNPRAQAAYYKSLSYFYAKHYSRPAQWALRLMLPFYKWANR